MSIIWERLARFRSWMISFILVVIAFSLVKSLIGFAKTRDRFDMAEKEVAQLEQERQSLLAELTLEDPAYVTEEQLRNSLGLSRPGESVVIIPEEYLQEELLKKQEIAVREREVPNWQKWLNLFWQ